MSAPGQAAGGQAAGGEGTAQGGDGNGQAPAFDAAALQQQLAQVASGTDQLRQQFGQFVDSAPWQPQAEPEAPAEIDWNVFDDPGLDPQQVQQQFQQSVQAAIAAQVGPIQQQQQQFAEQQQEFQRQQQIRDLVTEYPEFQDEAVAQRIAGPQGLARQVAEALGQPELGANPLLWKLVHEADRGAQAANMEQGAGAAPNAAHLEGGGGAGPGGGGQADMVSQILGQPGERSGAGVLPY